jgi:uncharacterized protein (DUF1330 family)
MDDKKTFLVISAIMNKENMSEVQLYLGSIMPVFAKNGGKPFGRFKTVENLTGKDSPEMVGIIEFPSAKVIKDLMINEDFLALAEISNKAFTKLNMVICEDM